MTHTSTKQQPEALRLVEMYDFGDPATQGNAWKSAVCAELRRLHARVQELEAELEHESKWRDLALQFDNHRLHAKWHIQHLIQSGCGDAEIEHANDFLNKPPLSGEKVLAERLAKLQASQAQRVPLSDEAIAEIAERFEAIDPTDSFWVEVCRAFESASVSGITQEKQG